METRIENIRTKQLEIPTTPQRVGVLDYLSLVKFAHTIFAMPFALIGFFYGLKIMNYEIGRPWWVLLVLV
ncbi:MAG TPA: hypothetical protein VGW31_04865, partial [Hanamia sp.]|nr:hypothetical protein [Hanamia sp.]